MSPPACCSRPSRSWGRRTLKPEETAYWLTQIIPTDLDFRLVDGRRVATTMLDDARRLTVTTDFAEVNTGLVSEDGNRDIRCELLTIGQVDEAEAAALLLAAADALEEARGTVPAHPGVLLPGIGARAGLDRVADITVAHGLLAEPGLWDGQVPHLLEDERMTLVLQLVPLTVEEYGIGAESGVDKLQKRLRRRGEDLSDWRRKR